MGIMSWLGIGEEIAKPINAIGNLYTTDKAHLEAEKDLEDVVQKPRLSQLEVNEKLAGSGNIFEAGWQPMIGWSCGFLIMLFYAPQFSIATYVWGKQCIAMGSVVPFPLKPDDMLNLVWLLFGFGGYSLVKK